MLIPNFCSNYWKTII